MQLLPRLAAEEEREDAAIAAVLPDGGAFRREARPEAEQRGEVAEAARIAEKPSARPLVKSALHPAGGRAASGRPPWTTLKAQAAPPLPGAPPPQLEGVCGPPPPAPKTSGFGAPPSDR